MNFKEAMKEVYEGKKIARTSWNKDRHPDYQKRVVFLGDFEVIPHHHTPNQFSVRFPLTHLKNNSTTPVHLDDLWADDWEVIE